MYISKKDREIIKNKFGGKCAYSGTILKDDWQVDHVQPIMRNWKGKNPLHEKKHNIDNMFPVQKIINHYKHSLNLEEFRSWYLGGLHERLKKLPKNPKVEKSIKRKEYLLEVAKLFDITEDKPFSGVFYFETLKSDNRRLVENLNKIANEIYKTRLSKANYIVLSEEYIQKRADDNDVSFNKMVEIIKNELLSNK